MANAIRIVSKLRQQASAYITRTLAWGEARRGREKEKEERKAVKVLDLLSHAASLGHMDALFTLAKIALVSLDSYFHLAGTDPSRSYHQHTTSHLTLYSPMIPSTNMPSQPATRPLNSTSASSTAQFRIPT